MMMDRSHLKESLSARLFKIPDLYNDRDDLDQIDALATTYPPSARDPVSPMKIFAGNEL